MAAEGGHFVDFAYKWPRSGHFDWKTEDFQKQCGK